MRRGMGKRGKRQGRGPRGGGRRGRRGPAGGAGAGAGGNGGGGRPGAGPAPRAGPWADLPRDLLEAVVRAVPAGGDRMCFRLVCRRWAAAGKAVAPDAGEEKLPPGKVTRTSMLAIAASVARAKPLTESNMK